MGLLGEFLRGSTGGEIPIYFGRCMDEKSFGICRCTDRFFI